VPTFASRTLSVAVDRPPADVYAFVVNPENLPRWAAGLGESLKRSRDGWIVETPQGPLAIRFAPANALGVLDHHVTVAPGTEVSIHMRVIPNGTGSELTFTFFQNPGMSDAKFAEDAALVERDLKTLKRVLEARRS
jgi:hypothetical protein